MTPCFLITCILLSPKIVYDIRHNNLITLFHFCRSEHKTLFFESTENIGLSKYSASCSHAMLIHSLLWMQCDLEFISTGGLRSLTSHLHLETQKSLLHLPEYFQLPWVSVQPHSTIYFLHPNTTIIHANMPIPPNGEKEVYQDWKSSSFHSLNYWKHCMLHPQNNMVDTWWLWCHMVDFLLSIYRFRINIHPKHVH